MSEDGAAEDNLEDNTLSAPAAPRIPSGPMTPRKGPPKFKQRQTRQFKSKPPKKGVKGFGDDIPGMEGLGTDNTNPDFILRAVLTYLDPALEGEYSVMDIG